MEQLLESIRRFNRERDWEQFHTPKNLIMALSVEVAELAEHFLWSNPEESHEIGIKRRGEIEEEIGDVLIYLLNFSDKLEIDPMVAVQKKLAKNAKKYPISKSIGKADKYSVLE